MNFSYGIIAVVGVLVAISMGLIAAAPDDIIEPRIIPVENKPTACTLQWDPMCGVDGKTYGNSCALDAADVKLDHQGECMIPEPEPVVETPEPVVETPEPVVETPEPVVETPSIVGNTEVSIGTVEKSGFSQDCVESECYISGISTVDVGGKVIMTNTDTTGVHTFTSGTVDGFTPSPSDIFDSDILLSGDSFEWIPDTAGEVPYYCMLHTWMVGTIIVQEAETTEEVMEEEVMEEEVMEEEVMEEEVMEEIPETSESSMELTISIPKGVGAPGCETTLECYLPYETTVKAGTTVTWINEDTTVHTVTSGRITEGTTGLFDSSIFTFGKSFEYTFNVPGTYDYFCNVHPWMAGIVHVN